MPAPAGRTLSHGYSIVATNCRKLTRPGPIQADERAFTSLREKLRVNERPEQRIANIALETPQALCLCRRQPKSGHFHELALNPLKHIVEAHQAASAASLIFSLTSARVKARFVPTLLSYTAALDLSM